MTTPATGLFVCFTRCNAPARASDWAAWLRERHLPDMASVEGVRATSHWALVPQPTPGMPSVGFSHVTLFELTGDAPRVARALLAREEDLRAADRIDPSHSIMGVDVLEAHGRFREKPVPNETLTGHILAYVLCNDPRRETEWDRWNDEVHMPDMLASDAFTGVSRWRRTPRSERGAQHLTLYDVGPGGVAQAVERSAAVMPGIAAAGRKHPCHVGGLTVTLERA